MKVRASIIHSVVWGVLAVAACSTASDSDPALGTLSRTASPCPAAGVSSLNSRLLDYGPPQRRARVQLARIHPGGVLVIGGTRVAA